MTKYAIWSWRKKMWWGPNHGGYTPNVANAGMYTRAEATDIMFGALPGQNVAVDEILLKNHFSDIDPDANAGEIIDSWRSF